MRRIQVQPRKLSPGEVAELQRLRAYTQRKEALRSPRFKGDKLGHTIITPPRNRWGALMLAPDNQEV